MMTNDPFPGLGTARLRLRCVRVVDAAPIAASMIPAVSATLATWSSPMTAEMALERIEGARVAAADGKSLPFAVLRREDSAFVGYVGLALDLGPPRRAKLGYWIGERYQGRGYAREASAAAVDAAFDLLEVAEVEAAVEVENAASASVLSACGLAPIARRMVPARGGEHLCDIYRRGRAVEVLPDRA